MKNLVRTLSLISLIILLIYIGILNRGNEGFFSVQSTDHGTCDSDIKIESFANTLSTPNNTILKNGNEVIMSFTLAGIENAKIKNIEFEIITETGESPVQRFHLRYRGQWMNSSGQKGNYITMDFTKNNGGFDFKSYNNKVDVHLYLKKGFVSKDKSFTVKLKRLNGCEYNFQSDPINLTNQLASHLKIKKSKQPNLKTNTDNVKVGEFILTNESNNTIILDKFKFGGVAVNLSDSIKNVRLVIDGGLPIQKSSSSINGQYHKYNFNPEDVFVLQPNIPITIQLYGDISDVGAEEVNIYFMANPLYKDSNGYEVVDVFDRSNTETLFDIINNELLDQTEFSCNNITDISIKECELLVAFYDSTGGDNRLYNTNWKRSNRVGGWHGVTVKKSIDGQKYVHSISLNKNNLVGNFPKEITEFKKINMISLGANNLSGNIPSGIGMLKELKRLYLSNNKLTGGVPNSFNNLNEMRGLSIENNNLCGNVPENLIKQKNETKSQFFAWDDLLPCKLLEHIESIKNKNYSRTTELFLTMLYEKVGSLDTNTQINLYNKITKRLNHESEEYFMTNFKISISNIVKDIDEVKSLISSPN